MRTNADAAIELNKNTYTRRSNETDISIVDEAARERGQRTSLYANREKSGVDECALILLYSIQLARLSTFVRENEWQISKSESAVAIVAARVAIEIEGRE